MRLKALVQGTWKRLAGLTLLYLLVSLISGFYFTQSHYLDFRAFFNCAFMEKASAKIVKNRYICFFVFFARTNFSSIRLFVGNAPNEY